MTINISCPNCGDTINSTDTHCSNCGIHITVAVALAEYAIVEEGSTHTGTPMTPEILVPRLGDRLIERGVLSQDDLQQALAYQKESGSKGRPLLLGQSLLELGMVEREVLDQVITEQILQLQDALHQSNRQLEKRVKERTIDLQNALNKLTELNQLKSSFIASISHELRTPLTHIKGYLDLMADGGLGELNNYQSDAVEVMLRAESRLEQLIDDLIRFSLAARGELSLSISPTNVSDLVKNSLSRTAKLAKSRSICIQQDLAENLPTVKADTEKISWVLLQLLDNAIKFTPEGGGVIVKASYDDRLVTVSVIDTGIGIPENRIQEIFEPFHQLDDSDTRRYGGTGLGLALVKRILDAHGSTIKVQSQEGQGSSFAFILPVVNGDYVRRDV